MSYRIDIQDRAKRDVLAASLMMMLINFGEFSIDNFTIFGLAGSVNAASWAYGLLWVVWLYFSYRYFVFNWSPFQARKKRVQGKILELAKATALHRTRHQGFKLDIDKYVDAVESYDGKGELDLITCHVHILTSDGQPDRKVEGFDAEQINAWKEHFGRQKILKQENFIHSWVPVMVIFLTLASGIVRLCSSGGPQLLYNQLWQSWTF